LSGAKILPSMKTALTQRWIGRTGLHTGADHRPGVRFTVTDNAPPE
jgi:hypothetical protein